MKKDKRGLKRMKEDKKEIKRENWREKKGDEMDERGLQRMKGMRENEIVWNSMKID